jgi:hypothetical protein
MDRMKGEDYVKEKNYFGGSVRGAYCGGCCSCECVCKKES